MATLEILAGSQKGKKFEISDDETVVGRHTECQLVLEEPLVSRQHARVQQRDGAYFLEDLGSRNGTYLNGQRIENVVRLTDRDYIHIYDVSLRFYDDADAIGGSDGSEDSVPSSLAASSADSLQRSETIAEMEVIGTSPQLRANAEVKLQAVLEITRNLVYSVDYQAVLQKVLDSIFRIFPTAQRGYVLEGQHAGDKLSLVAMKTRDESNEPATMRPLPQSIARQVLRQRKALITTDVDHDSGLLTDSALEVERRSAMCAPLLGPSGEPLGILYVDTIHSRRSFGQDDLDVLACVAILAGQVIEHASLQQARYRAVVDAAIDGIIAVDSKGIIESVNRAAETMFGYHVSELIGTSVRQLLPDDLQERLTARLVEGQRKIPTLQSRRELIGRRKNGSTFPLQVSIGEFELDGQRHYTGIVHDITERKQSERELKLLNETLEQRVEQRTQQIRLLHDVAEIANSADSVDDAFRWALRRICLYTGWDYGHVFREADGVTGGLVDAGIWVAAEGRTDNVAALPLQSMCPELVNRACASARPEWSSETDVIHNLGDALDVSTSIAVPVRAGDRVSAVMQFFSILSFVPDPSTLQMLAHVAKQLSHVMVRRQLQQELIDAVWTQQRRFGQELHDSLGQELTGMRMMAESLQSRLESQDSASAPAAAELAALTRDAQSNARQLSKGLFPVEVDAHGLMAALDELSLAVREQCQIDCRFECDRPVDVDENHTATHLFRIAQEATNNAVKHSQASEIVVSLDPTTNGCVLAVRDDGVGLPDRSGGNLPEGMGLRIMRYRAGLLGAELEFRSGTGSGTVVQCRLPHLRRTSLDSSSPQTSQG